MAELHQSGIEVVIVSSGAVAAGRQRLKPGKGLKGVPLKQILAATGQSYLMHLYAEAFQEYGITVAQALLTKRDLSDRAGYLNARNTILGLLRMGVVCIVNENDVVAIDELRDNKFGDNDNLSAMVSNLIDADLLVLLTDIAGLFTADPKRCVGAKLIPEVKAIDDSIITLAYQTSSELGTGGMITKIEAAQLATDSGVAVIIADGREEDIIVRLVRGEKIGTLFIPRTSRLESRKRWVVSGLRKKGRIMVDDGASVALRERNGSLLPAGIIGVEGRFERGDTVELCDSRKRIGYGITNYSSSDTERIKGLQSQYITEVLGYNYGDEVVHRDNMIILDGDTTGGDRKAL